MFIEQNVNDIQYENRFQNIKDYILLSFGYPLVRIELTNEHIKMAIIEAVTLYYQNAALDADLREVMVSGNQAEIPSDINPRHILDVIFEKQTLDNFARGFGIQVSDDLGIYTLGDASRSPLFNFDYVRYYQYLEKLEDFKRITGTRPEWNIVNKEIHLSPRNITTSRLGILYKSMPTDNDLDQLTWIKQYATARAKHILGTIRSKMSGFQASNVNIAVDGADLKSEAKEEMEKLRTELDGMRMPLGLMQV